jgi:hypothetical protein
MKEFADGWFARRHAGAQAAVAAAKRIGEAATPLDIIKEYQDWMNGALERLMADGTAYHQHLLKAGTNLSAQLPAGARPDAQQSDERRTG